MNSEKLRIAILVDGDNISSCKLDDILSFVSLFGESVIRRIYADWNKNGMLKHRENALEHSFKMVEVPAYVAGKNATDIALVIDAMDIIHSQKIQGICIVSGDSDYTLLAQRIREEGLLVLGYGGRNTPIALQKSCHQFCFSDRNTPNTADHPNTPLYFMERDRSLFDQAFDEVQNGNEEGIVTLSLIGTAIKKLIPKYKIKRYGYKTLGKLYVGLGNYEVVKTGNKNIGTALKRKDKNDESAYSHEPAPSK